MLNILVATKDGTIPEGLEYIGQPYHLIVSTAPGWANAANETLDEAASLGGDALFLDDDAILTDTSLARLPALYDLAEVFGFTLVDENGYITSAAHELYPNGQIFPRSAAMAGTPAYVAHVTTSAIYLKESVLQAGVRFPVWPGVHKEDIAFTLACWLAGQRVLYVPGRVIHPLGEQNVGRTKAQEERLQEKLAVNEQCLTAWMIEQKVMEAARAGRIPFGSWKLDQIDELTRITLSYGSISTTGSGFPS
jgi:hypothetical protein